MSSINDSDDFEETGSARHEFVVSVCKRMSQIREEFPNARQSAIREALLFEAISLTFDLSLIRDCDLCPADELPEVLH